MKPKMVNNEPHWQCGVCENTEKIGSEALKHWQMQHLHFSNQTIKFLTCAECKNIDPMEWQDLRKIPRYEVTDEH